MIEIDNYFQKYPRPMDILLDKESSDTLINSLSLKTGQLGLFDRTGEEELAYYLEKIYFLASEGRLYQRWSQVVAGKERSLSVPNKEFKKFVGNFLVPFIKQVQSHKASHGGECRWSPKASLETHLPIRSVLSFDLSSAFSNCKLEKVCQFYLKITPEDTIGKDLAVFLSLISTVTYKERDGARGLPQGASCSMPLFNRALYEIDSQLAKITEEKGFRYTRWVDDITISSSSCVPLETMVGAVEFVGKKFPIATNKVYFQTEKEPIYLLGHVIEARKIFKNSEQDREKNKTNSINYEEWFCSSEKNYDSW